MWTILPSPVGIWHGHKHNEDHTENCKLLVNNFVIPDAPCMVCLPTWTVKNGHMNKGKCRSFVSQLLDVNCMIGLYLIHILCLRARVKCASMILYQSIEVCIHTFLYMLRICIYNIQYICTPERCDRIVSILRPPRVWEIPPERQMVERPGWPGRSMGLVENIPTFFYHKPNVHGKEWNQNMGFWICRCRFCCFWA